MIHVYVWKMERYTEYLKIVKIVSYFVGINLA